MLVTLRDQRVKDMVEICLLCAGLFFSSYLSLTLSERDSSLQNEYDKGKATWVDAKCKGCLSP